VLPKEHGSGVDIEALCGAVSQSVGTSD